MDAQPATNAGVGGPRVAHDADCIDASCAIDRHPQHGDRARRLFGLCEDRLDQHGLTVRRIFVVCDRYAVYAADDDSGPDALLSLTFSLSPDEAVAHQLRLNLAPIAVDLARVSDAVLAVKPAHGPCRRFDLHRHRAFTIMARAMALAFDGATEEARSLLEQVRRFAEDHRDSANRMRYVAAITVSFALLGAAGFLLRAVEFPPFAAMSVAEGVRLIDVMLLGALGAWFSVALDVGKVRLQHAISRSEMIYVGLVRIPVGLIAAAVIVVLAQSGWMPGPAATDLDPGSLHLLGFAAGFSERLAPNILKQREAQALPAA